MKLMSMFSTAADYWKSRAKALSLLKATESENAALQSQLTEARRQYEWAFNGWENLKGHCDFLTDELATLHAENERLKGRQWTPVTYTVEIGEAGTHYFDSVKCGQELPALFRWSELWEAMCKVATPPDLAAPSELIELIAAVRAAIQDAIDLFDPDVGSSHLNRRLTVRDLRDCLIKLDACHTYITRLHSEQVKVAELEAEIEMTKRASTRLINTNLSCICSLTEQIRLARDVIQQNHLFRLMSDPSRHGNMSKGFYKGSGAEALNIEALVKLDGCLNAAFNIKKNG